jgi:hypothetical protein
MRYGMPLVGYIVLWSEVLSWAANEGGLLSAAIVLTHFEKQGKH